MASFYVLNYREENTFDKLNGLYFNKDYTFVDFKDDRNQKYRIELYPEFITDGGSIPKGLRWFMPVWDDNNILLNLAYCCHDWLYASEQFARSLADDLLRSFIRDAGYSRLKASTVCAAVNAFACCHYGCKYDEFDCAPHGQLILL